MQDKITGEIQKLLKDAAGDINPNEIKESDVADISSTIAFRLASKLKKSPAQIAEEIYKKIKPSRYIERIEPVNGYLNFYLNYKKVLYEFLDEIKTKKLGYGKGEIKNKKIILEHTSINPSGPVHVGRLRNSLIGDSLSRILKFSGYEVETHYYVNDIGKQIAIISQGFKEGLEPDKGTVERYSGYANKEDFEIFFEYVSANRRFESDPEFQKMVQELIQKAESGDLNSLKEITGIAGKCLSGQKKTLERLGIKFDRFDFESKYIEDGSVLSVLEFLRKSKYSRIVENGFGLDLSEFGIKKNSQSEFLCPKNRKAIFVPNLLSANSGPISQPEKFALQIFVPIEPNPKFRRNLGPIRAVGSDSGGSIGKADSGKKTGGISILARKDGTSVYLARDIAYHLEKNRLGDIMINVLGEDHKFEFLELKTILTEIYKITIPLNVVHFSFVSFEGGELSTRKGLTAPVDELLDDATREICQRQIFVPNQSSALIRVEKAGNEIEKRKIVTKEIAPLIGIGAIKYHILKTTPQKPITFKWEEALNFDGEASPYIQYAHARCCRILEKSGINIDGVGIDKIDLNIEDDEKNLLKQLIKFHEIVKKSAEELKPNIVANYLYILASEFSKFYKNCQVIGAEEKIMNRRLLLVNATRIVLSNGLELLGISAPERM